MRSIKAIHLRNFIVRVCIKLSKSQFCASHFNDEPSFDSQTFPICPAIALNSARELGPSSRTECPGRVLTNRGAKTDYLTGDSLGHAGNLEYFCGLIQLPGSNMREHKNLSDYKPNRYECWWPISGIAEKSSGEGDSKTISSYRDSLRKG